MGETTIQTEKPILCLDFDGVMHSYVSGWQGIDVIPDPPVDGVFEFIEMASEHFQVQVYSTRSADDNGWQAMIDWFLEKRLIWWLGRGLGPETRALAGVEFPRKKPPAFVSLDDRVLTFTGEWPDIETLRNFKPWNKE